MSFPGGFSRPDRDQHINEFLNKFQQSRQENNFNIKENAQGRLIAGSLFNSNVKMYRYTLIPKAERDYYKKFALSIVKEILEKELKTENRKGSEDIPEANSNSYPSKLNK